MVESGEMETGKQTKQRVKEAVDGSRDALEEIVRRIQKPVYSPALRMMLDRQDAEDAAQEILIRVITNLRSYRFEGSFRAWVLSIAVNKLRTVRKTVAEKRMASIEDLDGILDRRLPILLLGSNGPMTISTTGFLRSRKSAVAFCRSGFQSRSLAYRGWKPLLRRPDFSEKSGSD
jgi:RNA polymerase sigma factor (sigma-70 family)